MSTAALQSAALAILTHDSPILHVAAEVSDLIRRDDATAGIVGGIAVVLHGHVRTTLDVDVYSAEPRRLHNLLKSAHFAWDADQRQFLRGEVPVHFVTPSQVLTEPAEWLDLQGIRTVSLVDLINMKLHSGTSNLLRAQDMADVIALMRKHELTGRFTPRLHKELRPAFRKLLQALANERGK